MYCCYKFIQRKRLCSSTSPCAFSMAAYRADQQEEYEVTNCKNVKAATFKVQQFVYRSRKSHELFQKILTLTDPKCEPGASLIESSSHTNLTTNFSDNSTRAKKSRRFRLL